MYSCGTDREHVPARRSVPPVRFRPSLSLLLLAIIAPLAGFLPQSLGSRSPEPLDRRPTWAHLVFVTSDELPAELETSGPGFATLERRATRGALRAPPRSDLVGAAAILWTGRRSCASDATPGADALAWSLAGAAQRSGAVGAAILDRPLASEARLTGFERIVEDADLDPERMLQLAEQHLERDPARRKFLWLHLSDAGPHGERLDALLAGLHRTIDARGQGWDTLLLATALTGPDGSQIPLWAELPSDMLAGRQGRGAADLADVAFVVMQLLRLPEPDVTRGEIPVDAVPDLSILLRGGTISSPPAR